MTIVLATGGFDPIHSGHINYLKDARKLGDILYVGVNSDSWLTRKKGKFFMNWEERSIIVSNLKFVDYVIPFEDFDETSKDAIKITRSHYPSDKIIFVNGGDRTEFNIPEMDMNDSNLEFVFGVGGNFKQNSSSCILKNWSN